VDGAAGVFVLVGGWPGSGKTTLATALAAELRTTLLSKDVVKEALMAERGRPSTVEESRRLGGEAVLRMLRLALALPGRGGQGEVPLAGAGGRPFRRIAYGSGALG
jgi:predicted kinase